MPENEEGKLAIYDIERHSFESAKQSLEKYTEENQGSPDLVSVPTDGGLFGWFKHKVTGEELNRLAAQIQDYFLRFNQVHQGMLNELIQVYKALDALDKDYITAIVDSLKATEEVNNKAKKNRQDIEDSIANQEKIIEVLKNFKKKLEKLEHLTDIDKAWKMLCEQQETVLLLTHFKDELSNIEHIDDIDELWTHQSELDDQVSEFGVSLRQVEGNIREAKESLSELIAFRERLERIQHFGDIDTLWDDVAEVKSTLAGEKKTVSSLSSEVASHQEKLATFEKALDEQSGSLKNLQETLEKRLGEFNSLIEDNKKLVAEVQEAAVEQSKLIESTKSDLEGHLSDLESDIAQRIDELTAKMQEENNSLTSRCELLATKLKYAYMVAGGAAAVAIIHFILDLVGVL